MSGLELLLNIGGGGALLLWATRMIRTGIMRAYGADMRRFLARSTRNTLRAFGMGLGMAGLLQSSTATALLVVSFSGRVLIATAPGLAVMLGADVGSTLVVQVLSFDISWVSPVVILAGVIAFLCAKIQLWRHLGRVMIGLLAPYVELLGSEPSRQIANFHTAFNLALALFCLPLVYWTAGLVERWMTEEESEEGSIKARYLDSDAISTPSIALTCATREVLRMADIAEEMLRHVMQVFESNDQKLLAEISSRDDDLDDLHEAIKFYLSGVSRNALEEEDSKRCIELISLTTNLEHIGDIIDKNLLELAQKKIRKKIVFSPEGWDELMDMHARVVDQMQLAMSVFVSGDLHVARQLMAGKDNLRELEREHSEAHIDRLRSGEVESIESSALHLDVLRDLKRINSHLTSVAYPILDAEGVLRHSRLRQRPKKDKVAKAAVDEQPIAAGKQAGEAT